jgi:hypothetical protein
MPPGDLLYSWRIRAHATVYAGIIQMMKVLLLSFCAATLFAAAGLTRNANVSLIRVPNGGIQPQAMTDRTGALHLLYYVGDRMHGDLFYVKSSDAGVRWSRPLRVNSEAGTAIAAGSIRGGQIAIGQNGRIHVAWNGSSAAEPKGPMNPESGQRGAPMLYSRLNDSGTAFEPERNLMTHTFGLDGGGTIAADPEGAVYVSWHGKAAGGAAAGEAGRQVWIAKSTDNGKTFAAEEPAWKEPTGACGCCGMAMFSDSKGTLRELYRSATGNIHRDIYMLTSQDHGRSFEGRKLHTWDINACPMTSMAFSEGAGKVEGAWETGGQVFFDNLTGVNASPVSAPGEAKGHKHPRIAISPNGETLMAWTEGTSFTHGGSLAWQLYDSNGKAMGQKSATAGLPASSFGAVVAKPDGFIVIY